MMVFSQPFYKTSSRGPDNLDTHEKEKNDNNANNTDQDRCMTLHENHPVMKDVV
jgi:hypothetical protein